MLPVVLWAFAAPANERAMARASALRRWGLFRVVVTVDLQLGGLLTLSDFLTRSILGSRCGALLCRIWRLALAAGPTQVRNQRSRREARLGIDFQRHARLPRELPVAAHPEEQRAFADAQIAGDGTHAVAVLDHAAHRFDLARGGIPAPAHRAFPWRRRCSDAVMPKCARNARAKLHGLSNPHDAETSMTGSRVPASNRDACSRRARVANCNGPIPYSAWNTLLKYQGEKLMCLASSAMRTPLPAWPSRYRRARCILSSTWRFRRGECPGQRSMPSTRSACRSHNSALASAPSPMAGCIHSRPRVASAPCLDHVRNARALAPRAMRPRPGIGAVRSGPSSPATPIPSSNAPAPATASEAESRGNAIQSPGTSVKSPSRARTSARPRNNSQATSVPRGASSAPAPDMAIREMECMASSFRGTAVITAVSRRGVRKARRIPAEIFPKTCASKIGRAHV